MLPRPSYPQLDGVERVAAELPLGGEIAVLTDRRLVVGGDTGERSFALGQIAAVQARFGRMAGEMVRGGVLVAVALVLFVVSSPGRALLLDLGTALEPTVRQEQRQEGGGLAAAVRIVQQGLDALAAVAGALPWFGALLLLLGLGRIALGALGRTVVTIYAGGGAFELAQRGRRPALEEFAREIGRRLPAPRAAS